MPTGRIAVDITWSGASGSPGANIWHARADSLDQFNADFEDLSDILETFYGSFGSSVPAAVRFSFDGTVEGVGDDTGSTWTVPAWSVTGSQTGEFMPPSQCMLVSWRAATGGRSGRGRTFIGPLHESCLEDNGTPAEDKRASVQSAADALIASSSGFANGALGIYSRTEDVFRDFVAADVPNYFAVLRSRRD